MDAPISRQFEGDSRTKLCKHPRSGPVIAIFGISGSGKTTLGKILASQLGYTFVDIDSFYKPQKPEVTLSNGHRKKNWDTLKAIDIPAFQEKLRSIVGGVIVVGFALTDQLFECPPSLVIHLRTGRTQELIIQRAIAARAQSKPGVNLEDDALMVREYVYPFFRENLPKISVTANLDVYQEEFGLERRPIEELIQILLNYIDSDLSTEVLP